MDTANGKHSDYERRTSMRTSVRLSIGGDDDVGSTADGFLRPGNVTASNISESRSGSTTHLAPPSSLEAGTSQGTSTTPSRPSSIAKPPPAHDYLTLRDEQPTAAPHLPPLSSLSSDTASNQSRQADSLYDGPSEPSHPYEMYPQRISSVVTTSTSTAPDQSYSGVREPAHPYGMYPQATASGDDPQPSSIAVGFTGAPNNYQRRIGPDGEEVAGLLGPLGHTEELPPYTRYPNEAYARKPADEVPAASSAAQADQTPTTAAASVEPIPGAGGIGLATRDPEFGSRASTSDLESPRSRLSARSFTTDSSHHDINTAAVAISEKESNRKWQKRAKKKVWGVIPYWAIGLLTIALILMGIVLGAVIGTFLTRHKGPAKNDGIASHINPLANLDVIPLTSVPAGLPPLEVGMFNLVGYPVIQAPSNCFNVSTQSQSWTCTIPMSLYYLEVQKIPDQPETASYSVKLTTGNDSMIINKYPWGTQPPVILDPVQLILVNDTSQAGWPAWWLNVTYDKVVIISEDRFPGSSTPVRRKRNWTGPGGPPPTGGAPSGDPPKFNDTKGFDFGGGFDFKNMPGFAKEGEHAWICTWPDTLLEIFIYPQQNNSFSVGMPSAWPGMNNTSFPPWPMPTRPATSTSTASATTTLGAEGEEPLITEAPTPTTSAPGDPWGSFTFPPMPPMYPKFPKIVKIEERRIAGLDNNIAACRKVKVKNEGREADPVLNADGSPIEVIIAEKMSRPLPSGDERRWLSDRDLFGRAASGKDSGECGCVWSYE